VARRDPLAVTRINTLSPSRARAREETRRRAEHHGAEQNPRPRPRGDAVAAPLRLSPAEDGPHARRTTSRTTFRTTNFRMKGEAGGGQRTFTLSVTCLYRGFGEGWGNSRKRREQNSKTGVGASSPGVRIPPSPFFPRTFRSPGSVSSRCGPPGDRGRLPSEMPPNRFVMAVLAALVVTKSLFADTVGADVRTRPTDWLAFWTSGSAAERCRAAFSQRPCRRDPRSPVYSAAERIGPGTGSLPGNPLGSIGSGRGSVRIKNITE